METKIEKGAEENIVKITTTKVEEVSIDSYVSQSNASQNEIDRLTEEKRVQLNNLRDEYDRKIAERQLEKDATDNIIKQAKDSGVKASEAQVDVIK